MKRLLISVAAVAVASAVLVVGCDSAGLDTRSLTPLIGERKAAGLSALNKGYNAMTLSEKDENAIGESVAIAITNQPGSRLVPNDNLQRYVTLVGLTVANASSGAGNDWVFGVIDSPAINAFSGPHGYVFVTRGALRQMQNEAELAGVLGHEITHVCNHDGLEQVKQAEQRSALAEGMRAGDARLQQFSSMADSGFDFYTKDAFSQPQETRADQGAVQLLAATGYDASAYLRFLQRLQTVGGGAGAGTVMSTHPGLPQRIQVVSQTLTTVKQGGSTLAARFQRNTAGL